MSIAAVALGGALGCVLRYAASGWVQAQTGGPFPFGTLAVNVAGSFVIGAALGLGSWRFNISPEWRVFLTSGLCGGLTTFSTFSYETLVLIEDRQWLPAAANLGLNVALCLGATLGGLFLARAV